MGSASVTYYCPVRPSPEDPHLKCDQCGATQSVMTRQGLPRLDWHERHTLRGWLTTRTEDEHGIHRVDLCPTCRRGAKP